MKVETRSQFERQVRVFVRSALLSRAVFKVTKSCRKWAGPVRSNSYLGLGFEALDWVSEDLKGKIYTHITLYSWCVT